MDNTLARERAHKAFKTHLESAPAVYDKDGNRIGWHPEEIRACRYCGGKAKMKAGAYLTGYEAMITCQECGHNVTRTAPGPGMAESIALHIWNSPIKYVMTNGKLTRVPPRVINGTETKSRAAR